MHVYCSSAITARYGASLFSWKCGFLLLLSHCMQNHILGCVTTRVCCICISHCNLLLHDCSLFHPELLVSSFTQRVTEFMKVLEELNQGRYERTMVGTENSENSKHYQLHILKICSMYMNREIEKCKCIKVKALIETVGIVILLTDTGFWKAYFAKMNRFVSYSLTFFSFFFSKYQNECI